MKTQTDFMNSEKNTGDAVINRGYAIYDDWIEKKLSSQRIVDRVNSAAQAAKANKTQAASIEALSCLFALDLRIKEKYNTLLRCLLFYFSRRRETDALKRLQGFFHIEENADVRNAIEIVLNNLRERLEGEESGDGDDETHGGKRNGKAEEETVATEEKGKEQSPEDKAEEIAEANEEKDPSAEKAEETSEQTPTEEQLQEQKREEPSQEAETASKDEAKSQEKEDPSNFKEENNGPDEKAEPSNDKQKESNAYNNAIDFIPLFDTQRESKPVADQPAFIDEAIIDQMAKSGEDFIHHDPSEENRVEKEVPLTDGEAVREAKDEKSSDKDAYLYDAQMKGEREELSQDPEAAQETKGETKQEAKQETKQEPTQKNDSTVSVKQEKEAMRVPIQVDLTEAQENTMRGELNFGMTPEIIEAIKNAQSEYMREQLDLIDPEKNAPTEIVGKQEAAPIKQPSVGMNRK